MIISSQIRYIGKEDKLSKLDFHKGSSAREFYEKNIFDSPGSWSDNFLMRLVRRWYKWQKSFVPTQRLKFSFETNFSGLFLAKLWTRLG